MIGIVRLVFPALFTSLAFTSAGCFPPPYPVTRDQASLFNAPRPEMERLCRIIETDGGTKTQIRFVDPHLVTLADRNGTELLGLGSTPAEAPFTKGDRQTGAYTSGSYSARVMRETSGGIDLLWTSSLPLSTGDRNVVLLWNGALPVFYDPAAALGFPTALERKQFELTLCGHLDGPWKGVYQPQVTLCSAESPATELRLSTPWTNVAEIRETTTYDHRFAACRPPVDTSVLFYPRKP